MKRDGNEFRLGDWTFCSSDPFSDVENYPLFESTDVIAIAKDFAQREALRHGNRLDGPIAASYVSYWLQVLKDLNQWWLAHRTGRPLNVDPTMDVAIARAFPWRFTCQFVDYANDHFRPALRAFATQKECIDLFQDHISVAISSGALYSFTRYQKVSHFILDLAYDAGWSKEYRSVSSLKEREGVTESIERVTVHRALSLYFANSALKRGFSVGAREMLIFGFPDAAVKISEMTDTMLASLIRQPPKKAIAFLLKEQISRENILKNATAIANGALGIFGTR